MNNIKKNTNKKYLMLVMLLGLMLILISIMSNYSFEKKSVFAQEYESTIMSERVSLTTS